MTSRQTPVRRTCSSGIQRTGRYEDLVCDSSPEGSLPSSPSTSSTGLNANPTHSSLNPNVLDSSLNRNVYDTSSLNPNHTDSLYPSLSHSSLNPNHSDSSSLNANLTDTLNPNLTDSLNPLLSHSSSTSSQPRRYQDLATESFNSSTLSPTSSQSGLASSLQATINSSRQSQVRPELLSDNASLILFPWAV